MAARKRYKEEKLQLREATVLIMDGPGDKWLMLCRGTRPTGTPPASPRRTKPTPPRPRRRPTGNA